MAFDGFSLPDLLPLQLFEVKQTIHAASSFSLEERLSSKYRLEDFSEFLSQESFAQVYLAWHARGLVVQIIWDKGFEDAFFPEYDKGESFELMVNTRASDASQTLTKYCHHFVFLPIEKEGGKHFEVTRLRLEDAHPLATGKEITSHVEFLKNKIEMRLLLPETILHGYDPHQHTRIGINYKVNRTKLPPMEFVTDSSQQRVGIYPSTWAYGILT